MNYSGWLLLNICIQVEYLSINWKANLVHLSKWSDEHCTVLLETWSGRFAAHWCRYLLLCSFLHDYTIASTRRHINRVHLCGWSSVHLAYVLSSFLFRWGTWWESGTLWLLIFLLSWVEVSFLEVVLDILEPICSRHILSNCVRIRWSLLITWDICVATPTFLDNFISSEVTNHAIAVTRSSARSIPVLCCFDKFTFAAWLWKSTTHYHSRVLTVFLNCVQFLYI